VINLEYLGPHLTLHGGGADLLYPHHECEIGLAEAATQIRPFARLWWHTGMTRMDGQKMSKSLGNMVFVRDLAPRFGGDAVRRYVLETRYRNPLDWDETVLGGAAAAVERLRSRAAEPAEIVDEAVVAAVRAALEDDLDTPRALAILDGTTGATTRLLAGVLGFTFAT
jgi:cysteinyl-tRNA synthetase